MKVLTFSKEFPQGHPKASQPTWFVEKIWAGLINPESVCDLQVMTAYLENGNHEWWEMSRVYEVAPKGHTIRAGSRFKPGDMVSLRVWSDKPRRSKQIEFAQVEVKKTWDIVINEFWFINDRILERDDVVALAKNDGLSYEDFIAWFAIHPKSQGEVFTGQIICWNENIEYGKPLLTEKIK